ncbi:MAG: hypothetical protein ABJA18_13525 [bacterium]
MVRILVALLVLAGAIYLQYRLANIPLPVDVEKSKPPYTPITAEIIKREELEVETPTVDNSVPASVFLSGEGADFISVEARFDSAQISQDFIDLLQTDPRERSFPTRARQLIVYGPMVDEEVLTPARKTMLQLEKPKTKPCRTSIEVKLAKGSNMPAALHFFQVNPGSDRHRNFEIKADGTDVVVELLTRNFTTDLGEMSGPDCSKTLSIGEWRRSFTAPVPIDIVVPSGTSFRFSFTSAEGKTPWTGAGNFYEPFGLIAFPLNVRAVREVKHEPSPAGSASTLPILNARSLDGQPPLVLKYFRVGSDKLQLDFAGQAMVQENGTYAVTFSLLDFAKQNWIVAALLAMLDAALLEWIRRAIFKGTKGTEKS